MISNRATGPRALALRRLSLFAGPRRARSPPRTPRRRSPRPGGSSPRRRRSCSISGSGASAPRGSRRPTSRRYRDARRAGERADDRRDDGSGAEATRFAGLELPSEVARQLALLKIGADPAGAVRPGQALGAHADRRRARGHVRPRQVLPGEGGDCLDLGELSEILASSRDPERARGGLGAAGTRSRRRCARSTQRFVELANEGAQRARLRRPRARSGARSTTCRPTPSPPSSTGSGSRCKPLYDVAALLRARRVCAETYGERRRRRRAGPIPAHLLGNMWAQEWGNIYDLVAPADAPTRATTSPRCSQAKGYDALEMVRYGEGFFTSLGFAPLPETFWERSLFTKPRDREVVCHASAWDIDQVDDLRIKMCIEINDEDFVDHPPRARAQLLPARLQRAADRSSATAPTTASTRRSATPSRCRSRRRT